MQELPALNETVDGVGVLVDGDLQGNLVHAASVGGEGHPGIASPLQIAEWWDQYLFLLDVLGEWRNQCTTAPISACDVQHSR